MKLKYDNLFQPYFNFISIYIDLFQFITKFLL